MAHVGRLAILLSYSGIYTPCAAKPLQAVLPGPLFWKRSRWTELDENGPLMRLQPTTRPVGWSFIRSDQTPEISHLN